MQIPYVAPIEDFTDLLNILGSKSKFGERLAALNAQQELLNKSLDRYKEITDIEGTKQRAAGLLADAKGVKADVDRYAKEAKEKADQEAQGVLTAAQNKTAESFTREGAVAEREKKVAVRESAVDAKEKEVIEREKQAVADSERATQIARQAQAVQDKYTAKLGQLQGIAAE